MHRHKKVDFKNELALVTALVTTPSTTRFVLSLIVNFGTDHC